MSQKNCTKQKFLRKIFFSCYRLYNVDFFDKGFFFAVVLELGVVWDGGLEGGGGVDKTPVEIMNE